MCSAYQSKVLRNLTCKRVQCDEIWAFVGCKEKNKPEELEDQYGVGGDVWTWVAVDADTKLVITWTVGPRSDCFISDLANRVKNRIQLTTDCFGAYRRSVETTFGDKIDFAMVHKVFGREAGVPTDSARKYSLLNLVTERVMHVVGEPERKHMSTSFIERQNLTMRMSMRRFTRLTNAFSKKLLNHCAAQAIHFMHYNFARIHGTLRTTPAMAAGVASEVWELGDIVALLEEAEPKAKSVWSHARQAEQPAPISN